MVYALRVDQFEALEMAVISSGREMEPGELVDKFDEWLLKEPDPVDTEKTQLFAALGVGP